MRRRAIAANSGLGLPTRHFSGQFQLKILSVSFLIAPSSLSLKLLSERRRGLFGSQGEKKGGILIALRVTPLTTS